MTIIYEAVTRVMCVVVTNMMCEGGDSKSGDSVICEGGDSVI